jgi:hypothetical protein
MIFLKRDRTGDLVRLECDHCHRKSLIRLHGHPRITELALMRLWLTARCVAGGWYETDGAIPELPPRIVVCPRCAPAVKAAEDF